MGAVQVLRMESKSGIDILAAVGSKDIRTSLSVSIFDMKKLFKFLAKRRYDGVSFDFASITRHQSHFSTSVEHIDRCIRLSFITQDNMKQNLPVQIRL